VKGIVRTAVAVDVTLDSGLLGGVLVENMEVRVQDSEQETDSPEADELDNGEDSIELY